jgi:hypothetical protein
MMCIASPQIAAQNANPASANWRGRSFHNRHLGVHNSATGVVLLSHPLGRNARGVPMTIEPRAVPLSGGQVALVDPADYDAVAEYKWVCLKSNVGDVYAARWEQIAGKRTCYLMHRVLVGARPGDWVKHRNGSTLDNRWDNLVLVPPKPLTPELRARDRAYGAAMRERRKSGIRMDGAYHRLSDFSSDRLRAVCSICGPVDVAWRMKRGRSIFSCAIARMVGHSQISQARKDARIPRALSAV